MASSLVYLTYLHKKEAQNIQHKKIRIFIIITLFVVINKQLMRMFMCFTNGLANYAKLTS